MLIGYGALFVWGLMLTGWIATNPLSSLGNPMGLGPNDTWLHLGVAAFGLLVAVLPARRRIMVPEEDVEEDVDADRTAVIERDERTNERGPGITREERPPGLAH